MIEFQNIDDFKPPKTELYTFVQQRYLHPEIADLRAERSNKLAQRFESLLTPTTLPSLPNIEIRQLYESREDLIKKRCELLDSWLILLRPNKKKQLEIIDGQLDKLEYQILALQKNDRENEASYIEKFINDNDKRIQKYNSETNILG